MSFIPKPYEIYKHFKGNLYQITAIAEHTETGELLVIYQALYGDFKTYARPLTMFVSRVDREKYPDVEQEFRFELQGPEAGRQREEEPVNDSETAKSTRQSPTDSGGTDGSSRQGTDVKISAEVRVNENCEGPSEGELALDPLVLEFLDADDYEHRLNILAGLHHRITDEMITTMAIACDVEINDGDTEERYEALKTCLLTLEKYECNRLR